MKRIKYNSTTMLSISIILLGYIIHKLSKREGQYTHIEKIIKKYNGIKQSPEDLYYPTVSKPANSQIGVVAGDSVKVINK